jgi:hypothetical protein
MQASIERGSEIFFLKSASKKVELAEFCSGTSQFQSLSLIKPLRFYAKVLQTSTAIVEKSEKKSEP